MFNFFEIINEKVDQFFTNVIGLDPVIVITIELCGTFLCLVYLIVSLVIHFRDKNDD